MKRLVVIGLMPDQTQRVERRFRSRVKLTFIPTARSNTRLPAGAEYAILCHWSRHLWWEAACRQLPHERVKYCRGGVTSVEKQIEAIIFQRSARGLEDPVFRL
jgi:hypothetical protein